MKRSLCSLVALGLLVGVTGQAMAQPSYRFTILDVPGSSKASAVALGINAGQTHFSLPNYWRPLDFVK